ncbi:hypothetical protein EMCRGX_G015762 [Ephydatia muelleri]
MGGWNIFVRNCEGKAYAISIQNPATATIAQIKELVREKTGIETTAQRLIYGGQQLKDDAKLSDYKAIGDNAEIILVMRLPGGRLTTDRT